MATALGNRRKLDKAQAASIDDEYLLDEQKDISQHSWGRDSKVNGKKTKPTPRWQEAAMGLAFS